MHKDIRWWHTSRTKLYVFNIMKIFINSPQKCLCACTTRSLKDNHLAEGKIQVKFFLFRSLTQTHQGGCYLATSDRVRNVMNKLTILWLLTNEELAGLTELFVSSKQSWWCLLCSLVLSCSHTCYCKHAPRIIWSKLVNTINTIWPVCVLFYWISRLYS